MLRKEGGRGLSSIQERVDASIQRLEDKIKKIRRKTNYSDEKQFRQHIPTEKNYQKIKMGRKLMYGHSKSQTSEVSLTREDLDMVKKE